MNHCTKEELIAFERRIADLWEAGELPYLIHLSGGNEDQLIEIFKEVQPGDWVFSTHRNHYHALLSGMTPERLEGLIRRGQSMFVYEKHRPDGRYKLCDVNFLTSSVLAGTCAIAAGVAWEIKNSKLKIENREPHVWCFLGDGAEEEGHFYEAACFVDGHNLPCTFIIEDNDRSVDTDKQKRRGWTYGAVLGSRDHFDGMHCLLRYRYTPTYPHAGSGCKHQIQFKPILTAENTET